MRLLPNMVRDPREVIPESLSMEDKPHFSSCPSLEGLCFASHNKDNLREEFLARGGGGGGRTPIWKGQGCSSSRLGMYISDFDLA